MDPVARSLAAKERAALLCEVSREIIATARVLVRDSTGICRRPWLPVPRG
jgi:hypothetical protein